MLIEMAHDEAWEILNEYRDVLDDLVLELMEKETLGKTTWPGSSPRWPSARRTTRTRVSAGARRRTSRR
jgi:hypothetical protein